MNDAGAATDVLADLRELLLRYGGEMNDTQLESFKHELRGLVPRGRYVTRLASRDPVRVISISNTEGNRMANKFCIEFRAEAGPKSSRAQQLPVASFLELYVVSSSEDSP